MLTAANRVTPRPRTSAHGRSTSSQLPPPPGSRGPRAAHLRQRPHPEALLAAGSALGERRYTAMGLRLADWLLHRGVERLGHFSFTPVGGWTPGEPRPGFDQQPIEAWAMADLCVRAWQVTGEDKWRLRARRAAQWVLGDNDLGLTLYDAATGAGFDGLTATSVNENCGAESTLAGIACLQVAAMTEPTAPEPVTR
jgi:hypothetical protein